MDNTTSPKWVELHSKGLGVSWVSQKALNEQEISTTDHFRKPFEWHIPKRNHENRYHECKYHVERMISGRGCFPLASCLQPVQVLATEPLLLPNFRAYHAQRRCPIPKICRKEAIDRKAEAFGEFLNPNKETLPRCQSRLTIYLIKTYCLCYLTVICARYFELAWESWGTTSDDCENQSENMQRH